MLWFALILAALILPGIAERFVARRHPIWLHRLALPVGKARTIALTAGAKGRLVTFADESHASYRNKALTKVDWSQLEPERLEVALSSDEVLARFFLRERGVIAFVPRRTYGRNRGLWISFFELRAQGDDLVLAHRFYLGGLIGLVVLLVGAMVAAKTPTGALIFLPWVVFFVVIRVAITYFQLQSFPEEVETRMTTYLASLPS